MRSGADDHATFFEALWDDPPESLLLPAEDGSPSLVLPSGDARWRECRIWQGYLDASSLLLDAILAKQPNAGGLTYPALFALRHGLEVALKWHIRDAGGSVPKRAGHDLGVLIDTFRHTVADVDQDTSDALDHLLSFIDELAGIDPRSIAFRYATDARGSLIAMPGGAWDLRRLCFAVGMLTAWFDNLSDQIIMGSADYQAELRMLDSR